MLRTLLLAGAAALPGSSASQAPDSSAGILLESYHRLDPTALGYVDDQDMSTPFEVWAVRVCEGAAEGEQVACTEPSEAPELLLRLHYRLEVVEDSARP